MSETLKGDLEGNLEEKKDSLISIESGDDLTYDGVSNKTHDPTSERVKESDGVSATKVEVNYLNFEDRFKSEPQQAEDVTTTKDMEKYLRDTNTMMELVKEDETKLEKSVKRQEILTERIVNIGSTARRNTDKLTKSQQKNNTREEEKISQLNEDLGVKLNDLEQRRNALSESVPSNMDEKIEWIQSEEGQTLINQLLVDSLAQNNDELMTLAQTMVGRDVINEDPKSGFSELIERLADKHEFLVAEGGRDDMIAIPLFQHISKEASYLAGMSTEGNAFGKVHSTSLFDDPYASTGYGLLISDNMTEGGKTYKLSQRVGLDVDLGITEFNFFEIGEDGFTHISRATKLRFEGNTLNFSYQGQNGEETWTINAMAQAVVAPGAADMLIPGVVDMLIPSEASGDLTKKDTGMGE